jgi:hypothetical protein
MPKQRSLLQHPRLLQCMGSLHRAAELLAGYFKGLHSTRAHNPSCMRFCVVVYCRLLLPHSIWCFSCEGLDVLIMLHSTIYICDFPLPSFAQYTAQFACPAGYYCPSLSTTYTTCVFKRYRVFDCKPASRCHANVSALMKFTRYSNLCTSGYWGSSKQSTPTCSGQCSAVRVPVQSPFLFC